MGVFMIRCNACNGNNLLTVPMFRTLSSACAHRLRQMSVARRETAYQGDTLCQSPVLSANP
jgi:hypothetical protein